MSESERVNIETREAKDIALQIVRDCPQDVHPRVLIAALVTALSGALGRSIKRESLGKVLDMICDDIRRLSIDVAEDKTH